jgi:hypothetical protein
MRFTKTEILTAFEREDESYRLGMMCTHWIRDVERYTPSAADLVPTLHIQAGDRWVSNNESRGLASRSNDANTARELCRFLRRPFRTFPLSAGAHGHLLPYRRRQHPDARNPAQRVFAVSTVNANQYSFKASALCPIFLQLTTPLFFNLRSQLCARLADGRDKRWIAANLQFIE